MKIEDKLMSLMCDMREFSLKKSTVFITGALDLFGWKINATTTNHFKLLSRSTKVQIVLTQHQDD
ncbi:CLUMA_CG001088, isoform A [Clunio marinus]|uniref:CLUMA_CG001088, isoform A n=1 Tax=Clunio marinus TaxID=568069 RepID=A0A1J1HLF7_9DIPT|nr:CLUMA_CG001088, isoform A [Clunio marinus]